MCALQYSKYIDVTREPSQRIHSLGVLFKLYEVTTPCGSLIIKKGSHVVNLQIYGKEYTLSKDDFLLIAFTFFKTYVPHSQ